MKKSYAEMAKSGRNPLYLLLGFAVIATVVSVISMKVLSIPIVPVCSILILEVCLVALLRKVPVFVHGIALVAQLVAGFAVNKPVFMILMCLIYVLTLVLFLLWSDEE